MTRKKSDKGRTEGGPTPVEPGPFKAIAADGYEWTYTIDPVTGYQVGPDCKRCGAKDCHPIFYGYCSNHCEDMASDEAHIAELEAANERLRTNIRELMEPEMASLVAFSKGSFTFKSEVFRVLLAGLVQMLELSDVEDYLSIDMGGLGKEAVTLTIQRKTGKSPHQKLVEAEARLADVEQAKVALRWEVERLRSAIHEHAETHLGSCCTDDDRNWWGALGEP